MKRSHKVRAFSRRAAVEKSDHRHRRLLRARRERPCRRRAAQQRDELAPSHVEHGAPSPALGRQHPAMITSRPTAHSVALLHPQPTTGWIGILGTDLNCSESRVQCRYFRIRACPNRRASAPHQPVAGSGNSRSRPSTVACQCERTHTLAGRPCYSLLLLGHSILSLGRPAWGDQSCRRGDLVSQRRK
jgi:hypothetical protein